MTELYEKHDTYKRGPTIQYYLGPFTLKGSTRLYWDRALLGLEHDLTPSLKQFLEFKFQEDDEMLHKLQKAVASGISKENVADAMDVGMDWVYLLCNLYNVVAPFVKPLALAMPHVGVAWNIFDSLGAVAIAANEGKQGDHWAKKINILSAVQLSACTAVTIASLCLPAIGALSLAGTATGSFGFAAAMAISWGLEARAVNLCDTRIKYLVSEEINNEDITGKYELWRQAADCNDTNWYSIKGKFNKYTNYSKYQQEEKEKREILDCSLEELEKN